jgi:hypothetical protein
MGSMLDAHDLQRQPHRDMHNVLLRPQLHDELLLIMPRKPSEAPQKAAKPKGKGEVAIAPQKPPEPVKKMGRPSKYTPEIARQMCELLADGVPLRQICRMDGMPAWRTVYDWMTRDEALSTSIARAREVGQDAIAEQVWLDINLPPERILSEGGGRIDSGYVQWQKAKAEIALKLLAKWNPKRYGDRVQLAGDAENPIKIEAEVQAENLLSAVLKNVELKKQVDD